VFSGPRPELLSEWSQELVDWWGKPISNRDKRVLYADEKHWFVKFYRDQEATKRDILAYILGRNWANVAEVRPLNRCGLDELNRINHCTPDWASAINTCLIRLACDYSPEELPNTDLDHAVASELILSLWIRRRDLHAANRAYLNGIPIFFDHETAFLGDPRLHDLEVFFEIGSGAGSAGRWRVELQRTKNGISTATMRKLGYARNIALHFVNDFEHFNKCIHKVAEHVKTFDRRELYQGAREAGYDKIRANQITTFLEKNRQDLDVSIKMMQTVIFHPTPPDGYLSAIMRRVLCSIFSAPTVKKITNV